MKKALLFLLVSPFLFKAQTSSKKAKVLFLGNSYTYVNNLPVLIAALALDQGDTLIHDSHCPGGFTFHNHFSDPTTLSKISAGNWDYVVLQAQSQEPSFPPTQVSSQTLPYAIKLDSMIKHHNPCANTVFYETWGRKNGDASNCAIYPPVCTYQGMQDRLKTSYQLFADTVHDVMAPVGEAFRASIAQQPGLELYQPDESHPSLEGSFLAAAVFYEVLFQKSAVTGTYNAGISAGNAGFLKQTAHKIVGDSLAVWHLGTFLPWADFDSTRLNASDYQFFSRSKANSGTWYFGDGSASAADHPVHSYTASGTYTVSHVVITGCKKDSVSKTVSVTVSTSGIRKHAGEPALSVFPNPCTSYLTIGAPSYFLSDPSILEIRDLTGRLLYSATFTGSLNTQSLKNGAYFIHLKNNLSEASSCFIKNE